jgi:hypothetical protein
MTYSGIERTAKVQSIKGRETSRRVSRFIFADVEADMKVLA